MLRGKAGDIVEKLLVPDMVIVGDRFKCNLIERCFGALKRYRRIAARFDRNDFHFMSFLYLACSLIWLN
jgi:hypothetical protein